VAVARTALRWQHREGREDDPLDVDDEHGGCCSECALVLSSCLIACLQVERMFAYMKTNLREGRETTSQD
jgi:hypothetical protein